MFCQGNLQMNYFFYLRVCCSVWRCERSLRLLQLFLHNFQFTTATPTSFPFYIIPSCLTLCSYEATVPKGFSPLCILSSTLWFEMHGQTKFYTGCHRRKGPYFGRVFLMLNYTDITHNTYIQSWTVSEIMAREVWNFDSCYTLTDCQIHIETGRNMWFL